MEFEAAGKTEIGVGRTRNEEAFLVAGDRNLYAVARSSIPYEEGEHAAHFVLSAIRLHCEATVNAPSGGSNAQRLTGAVEFARRCLCDANQSVGYPFSTTRMAAILVVGQTIQIVAIGSCCVHRVRQGTIARLTPGSDIHRSTPSDGGPAHRWLEQGVDTPLGALTVTAQPGDTYVLSTMGIHERLTEEEILSTVFEAGTAPDVIERLVERALTAADLNNPTDATCVLIRVN